VEGVCCKEPVLVKVCLYWVTWKLCSKRVIVSDYWVTKCNICKLDVLAALITNRNCLKEISRGKKNWSQVTYGRLKPGQTGRVTDGRKLTAAADTKADWLTDACGFDSLTAVARPRSTCTVIYNLQTRPLVREGATILQTRNCLKEISRRKENWSQVPDGRLTPDRLAD
jgi:hypothetical protein